MSLHPATPLPYQRARELGLLFVQPKPDDLRLARAKASPPSLTSLSWLGSSDHQNWIAFIPSFCRGGHKNKTPQVGVTRLPCPYGDTVHNPNEVTSAAVASLQGTFYRTGHRDPLPGLDPGTPPLTTLTSTTGTPAPMQWRGLTHILSYPLPVWWRSERPYTAGRFMHSEQAQAILWNPENDGALLAGTSASCTLTRNAIDAILLFAADCEAMSRAAINLYSGEGPEYRHGPSTLLFIRPPVIQRPGASNGWPAFMSAREHRDLLDDFRSGCLDHLGLVAVLLRSASEEDVRIANPRDWVYPAFPGGSFFDALEAYDVLGGRPAGVIIDVTERHTHRYPPLELFASWGMPYLWYMHERCESAYGLRRLGSPWHRVYPWAPVMTKERWITLHPPIQPAPAPPVNTSAAIAGRFKFFFIIPWKDNAGSRFESRIRHTGPNDERTLSGLHAIEVSRAEVVENDLFEHFDYVEGWPVDGIAFKGYDNDQWVREEKAGYRSMIRGHHIAPAPPPDDEDDLDDDDFPAMYQVASGLVGPVPPPDLPSLRPQEGPLRPGMPFPRVISPCRPLDEQWRRAVTAAFLPTMPGPAPTPPATPSVTSDREVAGWRTVGPRRERGSGARDRSLAVQPYQRREDSGRLPHGGHPTRRDPPPWRERPYDLA